MTRSSTAPWWFDSSIDLRALSDIDMAPRPELFRYGDRGMVQLQRTAGTREQRGRETWKHRPAAISSSAAQD